MPSPDDNKTAYPEDYNVGPAQQGGGYPPGSTEAQTTYNPENTAAQTNYNYDNNTTGQPNYNYGNTTGQTDYNYGNTAPQQASYMGAYPQPGAPTAQDTQQETTDKPETLNKSLADKIESKLEHFVNRFSSNKK